MAVIGRIVSVKHFAIHDGPGIRTTLFFKGCPLHCIWCHNPESISFAAEFGYHAERCQSCGKCRIVCPTGAQQIENGKHIYHREKCILCGSCTTACPAELLTIYGKDVTAEDILTELIEDIPFYRETGGGVTLSGGEPLAQADFAADLLRYLQKAGIHTAVDTCGYVPFSAFESVLPMTNLFLYDIKHMDPEKHRLYTGHNNTLILENLKKLDSTGSIIEIRIPLADGINTDPENIHRTGEFLSKLSHLTCVKLLSFHNLAISKYSAIGMENTLPVDATPDKATVKAAASVLQNYGLNVILD